MSAHITHNLVGSTISEAADDFARLRSHLEAHGFELDRWINRTGYLTDSRGRVLALVPAEDFQGSRLEARLPGKAAH